MNNLIKILLSILLIKSRAINIELGKTTGLIANVGEKSIGKKLFCATKSSFILNEFHNDINKLIVKEVTGLLPSADIISKKVLEMNDMWITEIIDSRTIPEDLKKSLILNMIKIVENGDAAGTDFLHWYQNLVDCLLP